MPILGNKLLNLIDADKDARPYQIVGNALLERIRAGEFRASGKLPPERELAEAYDVGRAVIRDALVMLEVKGLIQSRQGSGIYITLKAYDSQPAVSSGKMAPAGGPLELLSARQLIESQIARQAAIHATETDIQRIEDAFALHNTAPDTQPRDELDRAFHIAIALATQNPELAVVVAQLWERRQHHTFWTGHNIRLNTFQHCERWAEDHHRIVEGIRRHDGDAAYVAMWQHIENVKQFFMGNATPQADRRGMKRK
ncbi:MULTISPECIES: FadR/GntR family transcriptional regulator [Asticcacaulis]|uniref:FadR/GntR family transcriptional regulator n=1 Tax=Asticcacaulis TaxID=76890 RepID=UPI001AE63290|nr:MULTISPECIES: FCD domain-containing protein [Asticcacaulis]MBP2159160.1 GntR family uxuAB operon transcriptional repressor [Asticcacaulis solisilvae]MDR6800205.1 GntR family uxuAB operon transcriptional repressor [Asticcacaulis sp. BE141]